MQRKADLEKSKKALEEAALDKDAALSKKLGLVGNYVHESVPISNNEVLCQFDECCRFYWLTDGQG